MIKIFMLAVVIGFSMTASSQVKKDSTAKKPDAYVLIGYLPDFQLLLTAIDKPGTVTRDQVTALHNWVNKAQPIARDTTDTTKQPIKKPKQ